MTDELPLRKEIVAQLRDGDRDPVNDADEVYTSNGLEQIEAKHEGRDGAIILQYDHGRAWDCPVAASAGRFDIFSDDEVWNGSE